MKLSKRGWIITAMAVFIIVTASLAAIYFQQSQRQEELDNQLVQVQTDLENTQVTKLISDKAELVVKLEEATVRLETVKGTLTSRIENSAVIETLFDVAAAHNLEIIELTSSVPSKQNLAGVNFSAILLTTRVKGNTSNVIDFVIDLNDRFNTGVTGSVMVTIPENSGGDGTTVDIRMTIYGYQEGI